MTIFTSIGSTALPQRLALANAAIEAAFRLRPDGGETHLARAQHLYEGYLDYDGALAELVIAHQSLPNDARLFALNGYIERHRPGGNQEAALRYFERAIELDPRNSLLLRQIAFEGIGFLFAAIGRKKELWIASLEIRPNDAYLKVSRAFVELDWKADTRPLHPVHRFNSGYKSSCDSGYRR